MGTLIVAAACVSGAGACGTDIEQGPGVQVLTEGWRLWCLRCVHPCPQSSRGPGIGRGLGRQQAVLIQGWPREQILLEGGCSISFPRGSVVAMAVGYTHGKHYVLCERGHWGLTTSTWVLCCESCEEPRRPQGLQRSSKVLPRACHWGPWWHPPWDWQSPTFFFDPSPFLVPRVSLSPRQSFLRRSIFALPCCHRFLTGPLSPPTAVSINGQTCKGFYGSMKAGASCAASCWQHSSQVSSEGPVSRSVVLIWAEFSTPYMNSICPFPFLNNYHLISNIWLSPSVSFWWTCAGCDNAASTPSLMWQGTTVPISNHRDMHVTVHPATCPHNCFGDTYDS